MSEICFKIYVDGSNKLNKMGKMLTDVYMGRCIKNTDWYIYIWVIAMFSLILKLPKYRKKKKISRTTKLALVFLTQDHKTWLTGRAMLLKSDWLTLLDSFTSVNTNVYICDGEITALPNSKHHIYVKWIINFLKI